MTTVLPSKQQLEGIPLQPLHTSIQINPQHTGGPDGDPSSPNTAAETRALLAGTETEEEARQRRIEESRRDREEANRRESKKVVFLCFDLTHFSQTTLFLLLSAGGQSHYFSKHARSRLPKMFLTSHGDCFFLAVLGFFLLNSWLEEYLFKELKNFKFGWYMTAVELLCFAGFAVIERYFKRLTPADSIWDHTAHFRNHLFVALAMTASRGLTNKSLEYLNYPTQVIFKSMKLITVMLGSLVILNQRFTIYEYISAFALVASAILFSLGDVTTQPEIAGWTGIIIVCASLVADALHSNTQEQLLKQHRAGVLEAMLYTNLFAALMSCAWVLVTGEFFPAWKFCAEFPLAYLLFVMRAAVIYGGVLCFVLMINTFGVVKATAITTVRKILTIIVSFILFPKPISNRHVLGFFIFSIGIGISVWDQRERARQKALAAASLPLTQRVSNV